MVASHVRVLVMKRSAAAAVLWKRRHEIRLEWSGQRCCSMEQFIGCDAHKKYSVFVTVNEKGHAGEAWRVAHEFLTRLPAHSAIAAEASSKL
jgi:hypothetical protein